jgi:hypothetical protein
LNGLVNFSAGVEAKPEVVNAFWSGGNFEFGSETGVSIVEGTGIRADGLWFESIFDFSVIAFVDNLWSATLYDVEVTIYNTTCFMVHVSALITPGRIFRATAGYKTAQSI